MLGMLAGSRLRKQIAFLRRYELSRHRPRVSPHGSRILARSPKSRSSAFVRIKSFCMYGNKPSRKMKTTTSSVSGFTLVELIMALTLTAFLLGVAVAAFSGALGSRDRESSRADALTSAQAA